MKQDKFREWQDDWDRGRWVGRGDTQELPADGKWAGGNADGDGDDDPINRMHPKSRTVGPKGPLTGSNT